MSRQQPLKDIRIVDFTMGWSGPLATRHMADMGAEVVKIEACKYPDWWRGWEYSAQSVLDQVHEKSPAFNMVNRNKYGITIDLTQTEGQALALKLVARADAVIENQATGVMPKLGLAYEDLCAVNPQIIMLSLPAFGAEGPWSGYRGYGSTVEHGAGLPHLTGEQDGPPVQTHVAYGDACGGLNAVSALLVALFHQKRTGKGQRVELSQVECMLQLGAHGPVSQGLTGQPPPRTANRHPVFVPHGCFACRDPDDWLIVAVTNDVQWKRLCEAINRKDLGADTSLNEAAGRRVREDELEQAIAQWAKSEDPREAMQRLQAAGVAAAVVQRGSELSTDPALRERGFWLDIDRAVVGRKPHPLTAWRYDEARAPIRWPSPVLGEHNHHVLGKLLNLSKADIQALEANGIIGDQPTVTS